MKLLGRDIDARALLQAARERLEARGIREESLAVEAEPEPVLEPLSFLVRALEEDEDPTQPLAAGERGTPVSVVRRAFRLLCQSLIDEVLERQRRFNARVREADAQLAGGGDPAPRAAGGAGGGGAEARPDRPPRPAQEAEEAAGMIRNLRELWQYRALLWNLTQRELKARYRGSALGFLWTFVNPLLLMAVYGLVFGIIQRSNIPHYTYFIFVGLLPWLWFSTSVGVAERAPSATGGTC